MALFRDRSEAGRKLADKLDSYANKRNVLILALPRGGVPVAVEVARRLEAPLDVFVVRKLGAPGREELAMGSIAPGGLEVLNDDVVRMLDISRSKIDEIAQRERRELERREAVYRSGREPINVAGKTVLVVDDGLATGATMRAAVAAIKQMQPERVVVAVPTAARESCDDLENVADDVICLATPEPFRAVGESYDEFLQMTDKEVQELLDETKMTLDERR